MNNINLSSETIVALIGIIVSAVVSIIAGIYAIVTNTKKFEIKEEYRKELLEWYTKTNRILIRVIHSIENKEFYTNNFQNERISLISDLSFYIELGRFYFPNIIDRDEFGNNKPSAYKGYRHIALEFLMSFYDMISSDYELENTSKLVQIERHFTSFVFDAINPRDISVNGVIKDKGQSGSKINNLKWYPTAKTKSSLRTLPMSDNCINYLQNLKKYQECWQTANRDTYNHKWDGFICIRPNGDLIPLEYMSRRVPVLTVKAGLPRLKLHELRHTNLSMLLENGANIKQIGAWAGHSNDRMLLERYAHLRSKNSLNELTSIVNTVMSK